MYDSEIDSVDLAEHDRAPDAEETARERPNGIAARPPNDEQAKQNGESSHPWNLGVLEPKIFCLCNQNKEFLASAVVTLKAEYFEKKVLGDLFDLYKETYASCSSAPTRDMAESRLRRRFVPSGEGVVDSVLDKCFATEPIPDVERYHIVSEAAKFARKETIYAACITLNGLILDGRYEKAAETLDAAVALHPFEEDCDGDELFDDMDAILGEVRAALEGRMATGYPSIDKNLNGGWGRKELVCVMGPPVMGKSIFLVNWGVEAIRNGFNVIHYTFEMSRGMLALRYFAAAAEIPQSQVLGSREKLEKARMALRVASGARLHLKEFPTSGASVIEIAADLDARARKGFKPDIVIVDYGDIMKAVREHCKSAYEEQGWIFRELRKLAIERNVAVITATQAKREALNRRGGTTDEVGMDMTADSMEKNRILDALFSIKQNPKEREHGEIALQVAKNRNGPMGGLLPFHVDYARMTIKEGNDISGAVKECVAEQEKAKEAAEAVKPKEAAAQGDRNLKSLWEDR